MGVLRTIVVLSAVIAAVYAVCDDQNLLPNPSDPSARGPYDVGAVTTRLTERNVTTEIWYPAVPGSGAGHPVIMYDLRDYMPPRHDGKIPDHANPWVECDRFDVQCHRELPLDTAHGPYPVMVFVHGTAGFRMQSLAHAIHWASRGFIVVACDHPGIHLGDMLLLPPPVGQTDQAGDARRLIASLEAMTEDGIRFLDGFVDMSRVAVSGHSAGGSACRNLGDVADVLIPMASAGVNDGPRLKSTLVLGGMSDGVVSYSGQRAGFVGSPTPKRLIGIEKSGHHFCAEMCYIGRDDGGLVEIAVEYGISEAALFRFLAEDGCDYTFDNPNFIQPEEQWPIVNFASTAVLEEILMCDAGMPAQFSNIQNIFEDVGDFEQDLAPAMPGGTVLA